MRRLGPLLLLLTGCAADPPPTAVGVCGCAGRGCHGALEPVPTPLHAAATAWLKWDKHARAFEALQTERSADMVGRLGWPAAAGEPRCLGCHGPAPHPADGVGCESCHTTPGRPTADWLTAHWRLTDTGGALRPLKTATDRAAACVGCHVGEPGREVTHDLIAAGHPRLTFDLLTFLELMPPHWPTDRDVEPKPAAWQAGQVVAAKAALTQAIGRAVPDLADRNCFACHHRLTPGADRPEWTSPLVSAPLQRLMGWGEVERRALAIADPAALRGLRDRLTPGPVGADRLAAAAACDRPDWDGAAHGCYALRAAGRPAGRLAEVLRLPRGLSPVEFDPAAAGKLLAEATSR